MLRSYKTGLSPGNDSPGAVPFYRFQKVVWSWASPFGRMLGLQGHAFGVVFVQFFIVAASCQEFTMGALLDDLAVVYDEE